MCLQIFFLRNNNILSARCSRSQTRNRPIPGPRPPLSRTSIGRAHPVRGDSDVGELPDRSGILGWVQGVLLTRLLFRLAKLNFALDRDTCSLTFKLIALKSLLSFSVAYALGGGPERALLTPVLRSGHRPLRCLGSDAHRRCCFLRFRGRRTAGEVLGFGSHCCPLCLFQACFSAEWPLPSPSRPAFRSPVYSVTS